MGNSWERNFTQRKQSRNLELALCYHRLLSSSPFILQRKYAESAESQPAACCKWLCTKWKSSAQHTMRTGLHSTHSAVPIKAGQALFNSNHRTEPRVLGFGHINRGADSDWTTQRWENQNLRLGRIKVFCSSPNPFVMFFHLTTNRGEKNQAKVASRLWYTTRQMFSEKSMAKQIPSVFSKDGEGALFTAGDTRQNTASEIFTAPAFQERLCPLFSAALLGNIQLGVSLN